RFSRDWSSDVCSSDLHEDREDPEEEDEDRDRGDRGDHDGASRLRLVRQLGVPGAALPYYGSGGRRPLGAVVGAGGDFPLAVDLGLARARGCRVGVGGLLRLLGATRPTLLVGPSLCHRQYGRATRPKESEMKHFVAAVVAVPAGRERPRPAPPRASATGGPARGTVPGTPVTPPWTRARRGSRQGP